MPSRCDRMRSREARKYAETRLLSVVRDSGAELSAACPLGTELDLLIEQERGKRRISARLWGCGLCHKQFRTEHHLDAHLDRRHGDRLPTEGSCPADYCDILRCESWASVLRKRLARRQRAGVRRIFAQQQAALLHTAASRLSPRVARSGGPHARANLERVAVPAAHVRLEATLLRAGRRGVPGGHPPCDLVPPRSAGSPHGLPCSRSSSSSSSPARASVF